MGTSSDELYFKPKLRVLSDDQIKQIHLATLDVLEHIGIKMTHKRGVEILESSGARVEGNRVRIPSWMVEDAIRKAPPRLVLGKRTGERMVVVEADKSYFGPSLDCMDYMDPATHKRIRFTTEHAKEMAALCDGLPGFEWCMTIGMADDVPADTADRVVARNVMEYCEKPLVFCCKDTNSVKDIHEMALLLCGGKENFEKAPCVVHYSEPISPLVYYDPAVEKMLYSVENGIPLINFPCTSAGGSGPVTLAGTMVQASAESLSGLVLAQIVKPGAQFVYGAFTSIIDMRTTIFSYGANEFSLMTAGLAQMAQHYRLPFFGTGGATDAKFCDAQAGAEATLQCFSAAATGSGLVHDCSTWMDHGVMVSPEFMVLVNEIVDTVKHYMRGIPVTRETLALDVIEAVGPGGQYLQQEHTMQHFRNIKYSELFDHDIYGKWESSGAKRFEQRLQEITLEKMKHRPKPLPEDVVKELNRMQSAWK